MISKMLMTIENHNLIQNGETIVVGFSGGPDSLAMLHALYQLKSKFGIKLVAVHVNHRLRGALADRDEAFVTQTCASMHIPCEIFKVDVAQVASQMGKSFEEVGREVRYKAFFEIKEKYMATKVAVAQNRNDVVETFFINLFRGAGIDGLASIEYMREGGVIRPLLDVSRDEIERYCSDNALTPCIDHTNNENDYSRNKIRNLLLPMLRASYNPSIDDAIMKTVQIMKTEKQFWKSHVVDLFEQMCEVKRGLININLQGFNGLHMSEKHQLLRAAIKELRGDLINVSYDTIERVILLDRVGAICEVDASINVRLASDALVLYDKALSNQTDLKPLNTCLLNVEERNRFILSRACVAVDAACIKGELTVRTRQNGDKYKPLGMKGHKKIQDLFVDEKIPFNDRENIMIVCDEEKIIWVENNRINDCCKITESTKNIMIMSFRELVETL